MIDDGTFTRKLAFDPVLRLIAAETEQHYPLESLVMQPDSLLATPHAVQLVLERYTQLGGQPPDGATGTDLARAVIAMRRQIAQQQ